MIRRQSQFALLGAVFSLAAVSPALADFVRLGSVDVGYRMDRDTSWSRFGGPMEGLRFVAGGSDILCRNVTVTYGNGERQNVFRGMLSERQPVTIDVRGGSRRVNRIEFTCRSDRFRGGKIYVAADVGRFREEWQRSPGWATYWSRVFNWQNGPGARDEDVNQWVSLGKQTFVGGRDVEGRLAGWAGRSIDRIALRALDGDARCTRVQILLGNGHVGQLDVGTLDHMEQGRTYRLDLPGGDRNVTQIAMRCRGLGQRAVTIALYTRK